MLSKLQANLIAEQVLSQAREEAQGRLNDHAPPVPPAFRCRELNSLDPWQRAQVVRLVTRDISNRWQSVVAALLWLFICAAYILSEGEPLIPQAVAIFCGIAIPVATYIHFARREIKRVAIAITQHG